jgi:alpha-beta hydrolase superfamily lysophospholipase
MRPIPSRLSTADGVQLRRCDWPPDGAARGTLLVVHGLGEHIGRYDALARRLSAAGWHVTGFDQRGHGQSEGARGAIARSDALLQDLSRVIDAVRKERDGPLITLGHSMGGLTAARFVAEGLQASPAAWHRAVDGLVLSSPALDTGMSAAQRALLAVLGPLAPGLAVSNGLRPAWISRDPAVVAAYVADPLVHDRITPRLARFIVDGGAATLALAARWTLPTLLLWAGSDRCVAPAGSQAFADAAPPGVVQSQCFEPLFHEIFNEPERDAVFAVLESWLARRAGQ